MYHQNIRAAFATSAAKNAVITMVVSATRPAVFIFTLPLLAGAISDEMLGYWMALLALTAIFGCLNTGVSSFVVTGIASSEPVKETVRYAAVIALACSALALAVGGMLVLFVDIPWLFKLEQTKSKELAEPIMLVAFLALAVGFPAQIGRFVAIGALEGYKAQVIENGARLAGALIMVVTILLHQGTIVYAVADMLIPSVLMLLMGAAYLVRRDDPGPLVGPVSSDKLKNAVSEAALMAGHQGMLALNQHGDVLIVATLIGPFEAALYGIGQRLAVLANYFITPINLAFCPELAKFRAHHQVEKLRKYFLIQVFLNLGFALLFSVAFAVFGNYVIILWMGENYTLPLTLIAGISSTIFAFALVNTMEMMLRAQKRFKFLFFWTSIGVTTGLVAKLVMASQLGAVGVAWAAAITMILIVGVPYSIGVFRSDVFLTGRTPDRSNG